MELGVLKEEEEEEEEDEDEEDEQEEVAVLRYERQITELLVVILKLNRKIDRLTLTTSRVDDEYLETCSDLSDNQYPESRMCQFPDQDLSTDSNCPGQPCPTSLLAGEPCDLSGALHKVLTEIEDTVHTWKAEIPHHGDISEEEGATLARWELVAQTIEEVEQELDIDLSPELREERMQWELDMECLREKNQQLRDQLHGREQELQSTMMAVGKIQRERDKLRLKADELLSSLQNVQRTERDSSPPRVTGSPGSDTIGNEIVASVHKDPGFALEQLMQSFQNCSGVQEFSRFLLTHESNVVGVRIQDSEMEVDQLRNSIDEWKERNNLLSGVLQECKGDCERLSMLLGKHESNSTALSLALQYSEDCIEAYGKLLVKAETVGRQPDAGEPEVDSSIAHLRGEIVKLRQGYTAMKQTIINLGDISPNLKRYQQSGNSEVMPVVRDLPSPGFCSRFPGRLQQQNKGKEELQQDLMAVREDMSWLKSQLSWMKKEKRRLEQKLQSQDHQDEAIKLLLTHWQEQRDEWLQEDPRTGCVRQETKSATCKEELVSEPTVVSLPEKHLRDHIEELATSLARLIEKNNTQKYRSEELATELKNTHSNLCAAFRRTKKKYENQLSKLESQVDAMSERQAAQLQLLEQRLMSLQQKLDHNNGTPL
ncbi:colorectal mutant cancer protein-like isoform X2 [Hemitrygon akajei]|uniref:colorectal mutant cancer protein-like isoform X2 n=1 Tax=Hemitrygon akajei TaxID=2704970 RepID=UPI003BFA0812